MGYLEIKKIDSTEECIHELSELLIKVVDGGASIGFLPPIDKKDAKHYWESVINSNVILLVAKKEERIVGTVQLHLCTKQNGKHRAEVAKLMTDPDYLRLGIARALMNQLIAVAIEAERTLLVLDTREGDPSNTLYLSMGFEKAGRIPNYASNAEGTLDATIIYYKTLVEGGITIK
ncbi:GNAT family N-acetyltransferase [Bacillus salitolerans]|uniref:GNAT family N-acetyltransferase n=1 Tax=Bacillus salitolerans TaxID=1437434 RepID=A0ABW4LQG1_9BACI